MPTLNTSDLYQEMQELNDRQQQYGEDQYSGVEPLDDDDEDRLAALVELFAQVPEDVYTYGKDLIPEDEFTDYARDYAEELAGSAGDHLFSYVDWDRFASEFKIDFVSVEFDGITYLSRA